MTREEKALKYKHSGYNCCQAVLLSFAEELGMDEETLKMLGSGFGAGMGSMEGNCGALIGAVMADNLKNARKNPVGAKKILAAFQEQCGALRCADLKGRETGNVLCSCDDCVRNAVNIVENAGEPPVPISRSSLL
ncbi:MAG: C_GCAxxG_C_C family protein [Clostridia bacterium]|nr:C_GCAxxG_C_C family protein [Clostridia bacterium]